MPSTIRSTRDPGPMARSQASSRSSSSREKSLTSGSSVTGTARAIWRGSNSTRVFQARKVRVVPMGVLAPRW